MDPLRLVLLPQEQATYRQDRRYQYDKPDHAREPSGHSRMLHSTLILRYIDTAGIKCKNYVLVVDDSEK